VILSKSAGLALASLSLATFLASPALAQTAPAAEAAPPAPDKANPFKPIWDAAVLHEDDKADVFNELKIVGRFHVDNYVLDSDIAEESDLLIRRARVGASATLFKKMEVTAQVDLNLEGGGPVYNRLTDAYVAWTFSDAAVVTVGKQSVEFTMDGRTSSNRLLTIDRSNVSNNFWFPNEYLPGVSLQGDAGPWNYQLGLFSAGEDDGEFGNFKGGQVVIAGIGRDVSSLVGNKQTLIRVDYVHNEPDPQSNSVRPFEHIVSTVARFDQGGWGMSGGLVLARGYPGQSDAWGSEVLSWVDLSEKFQLVGRYSFLDSEENNGLRLARYENVATSGRGDRYHEVYGGVNWYIYGHKLKLQSGLTYANMRDRAGDGGRYDGITWTTGLRVSW